MSQAPLVLAIASAAALVVPAPGTPPLPFQPRDAPAAAAEPLPTVAGKTDGLARDEGFLTLYRDDDAAKLWLVVPPPDARGRCLRFLYVEAIATGVGSNPLGLDRGQLGPSRVLSVRRLGPRILFEAENLRFRAGTDDADERRAVRDSFATSVLWGAEIAAIDDDGTSLVDLTTFIARDAHGVARRLHDAGEGSWSLDAARSAVDPSGCLVFPDNVELEAVLTFAGEKPGRHVRAVTPSATALTVVQHHALIRLPDDDYEPRRFDPRCGAFGVQYIDYAAGLAEPVERHWIARHRLVKTDPAAEYSPAVEPIVYYVDRGAPEPIRSALIEGASWWTEAFAAAGFENAFRVELLPEGAHPLDVRYNVIQWVHRATRGWSYGGSIEDPRTGEILKGHVTLGSLRVRQDILLFEGLAGTDATGTGAADDPVTLALARLRQLSAHEVGHTLGFAHNFAASTWGGRASVMDYPAPLIDVTNDGALDFSRAYATGIGAWDVQTVRYAYSQFAPGADEAAALTAILAEAEDREMHYLTDQDARGAGTAHPRANLWDNGDDPRAELDKALRIRAIGLARFGIDNIAEGRSTGRLQDVFVPLYLHHRYQLQAALKVIGGRDYRYAVRGAAPAAVRVIGAPVQRRTLETILACIAPARLDLPDDVLALLAPNAPGDGLTGERFDGRTAPMFDPLDVAVTAATPAIDGLLHPARCGRLVEQHRRDPAQLSLDEVVGALTTATLLAAPPAPRLAPLQEAIAHMVVERLAALMMDRSASPTVRAVAEETLVRSQIALAARRADPVATGLRRAISRSLDRRTAGEWTPTPPAPMPPGAPIGARGCGLE